VRHILNGVVALLSIGAFLLALYLAYHDQVAAAGVCIAAAILPILFSQLPFLEYLKILGLEAKLRERVSEADAIISNLKRIASVSAEQMFSQVATAGRWGGESLLVKKERADQLTAMLLSLDIPAAEILKAKTTFLRAIGHDLAYVFYSVVRNLAGEKKNALARERNALFGSKPIDMRDPKGVQWEELLAQERQIDANLHWPENVFGTAAVEDMKAFCLQFVDSMNALSDDETSTLVAIADEVDSLFRGCRESGNYTPETIRYLEKYQSSTSYVNDKNLRFAEAFPDAAQQST